MSLINNALKKAQRLRESDTTSPFAIPGNSGGSHVPRGRAMPAQTLILLIAGAAALVIISIVGTIYLMRGDAPPPSPALVTATPVERTPDIVPHVAETNPVVALPVAKVVETPAAEIVAPAPEPVPAAPAQPSESAYAYVDQLQVMGVRSSGADSKVLMNDRVYRINDVVNRTFGLKLTHVSADTLTFVDAAGATYEKKF